METNRHMLLVERRSRRQKTDEFAERNENIVNNAVQSNNNAHLLTDTIKPIQ